MKIQILTIFLYMYFQTSLADNCTWDDIGNPDSARDAANIVAEYLRDFRETVERERYPYQKLEELAGQLTSVLTAVSVLVDITVNRVDSNPNAFIEFQKVVNEMISTDKKLPNTELLYQRIDGLPVYAVATWKGVKAALDKAYYSLLSINSTTTTQAATSNFRAFKENYCPQYHYNYTRWMAAVNDGSQNVDGLLLQTVIERVAMKSRKLFAEWSNTFFGYTVRAAFLNHICYGLWTRIADDPCAEKHVIINEHNKQIVQTIVGNLSNLDEFIKNTWWAEGPMWYEVYQITLEYPGVVQALAEKVNKTLSEKHDWVEFSVNVYYGNIHEFVGGHISGSGFYQHRSFQIRDVTIFVNWASPQTRGNRTANWDSVDAINKEIKAYLASLPGASQPIVANGVTFLPTCSRSLEQVLEIWKEKLGNTAAGVACSRSKIPRAPVGSVINAEASYVYERNCSYIFDGELSDVNERCMIGY